MTAPDEPFGKIGGDGTERRIHMRGKAFTAIVALLLITLAVAPSVSAYIPTQVNPPMVSDITRYSFKATASEPLNKYSFVTYWLKDKPGYNIRTPIIYTKPFYTWKITVPGRWGGRQIGYSICTMDAPYKWTRMDCENTQYVQLSKWRYPER